MVEVIISSLDFEEIKKEILNAGIEKFHVVADFDRTLTKCFHKGQKASSLISHLRNGNYISKEYVAKSHALFDEYHPIEIDPNIFLEEKKIKMTEWWTKHFQLLIGVGLDKTVIKQATKDMIEEESIIFRGGVKEFLIFLKENNIPLIIMSAGMGDLIIEFLKQNEVYYENIHVISNLFDFDEDGKVKNIKKIIHVFNKVEMEVKVPEILERKNVLLLGDSIGDLGMVKGFEYNNLISVGFLNENVEENLEVFKDVFDVVLLGDGDFSFINDFVQEFKS